MYEWIKLVRRGLKYIAQVLYIILILNTIYAMYYKPFLEIKWIGYISLLLLISFFAREHATRGIYLILMHIPLGIVTFFLVGNTSLKWLIIVALFFFFMDGLVYIKKGYELGEISDLPWFPFLGGIATLAISEYLENESLKMMGFIIPVILIFIYLFSMYFQGLERYIHSAKNISGAPLGQIISVNSVIIAGIMVLIIVFIGISNLLNFPKVVYNMFVAVIRLIYLAVLLFLAFMNLIIGLLGGGMYKHKALDDVKKVAEGHSILADIIYFIFAVAVFAVCAYVLIRVIKLVIKIIVERQDRSYEDSENLNKKSNLRIIRERIVSSDKAGRLSPEMKARKIYRGRVLTYRKFFMPDSKDTAGDIDKALKTLGEEYDSDLTGLYENVRYGGLIPDKNYLEKMKGKN